MHPHVVRPTPSGLLVTEESHRRVLILIVFRLNWMAWFRFWLNSRPGLSHKAGLCC